MQHDIIFLLNLFSGIIALALMIRLRVLSFLFPFGTAFISIPDLGDMVAAGIDSWYLRCLGSFRAPVINIQTVSNEITASSVYVPIVDEALMFQLGVGGVIPTGLALNTLYYVKTTDTTVFTVSLTKGGTVVDITTGGTLPIFVRRVDVAYYALKSLYDGNVDVSSIVRTQQHSIPLTRGAMLTASSKFLDTSKDNMLKMFDKLIRNKFSQVINLFGGGCLNSAGLAIPTYGLKAKFVCEGDSDKDRYMELSATRKVNRGEIAALLGTAAPSYGTPDALDALYQFASLEENVPTSAGFESLSLADAHNGLMQEIGSLENCSLVMEQITSPTSIGEEEGALVKVDLAADALQASAAEMAQLQNLSSQAHYIKPKLLGDGTILALGNSSRRQVGLAWSFKSAKDADGHRIIQYKASGILKASELGAVFV